MRRARRDGQQSMYWTKKLLDFEERDPDRWGHSGFRELYLDNGGGGGGRSARSRERQQRERDRQQRRPVGPGRRPDRAGPADERPRRRPTPRRSSSSSSSGSSYSGSSSNRSRSPRSAGGRRRRSSSSSWSSSSTSVTSRSASPTRRTAATRPGSDGRRPSPSRPPAPRQPARGAARPARPGDRARPRPPARPPGSQAGAAARPVAPITRRVTNQAAAAAEGAERRRRSPAATAPARRRRPLLGDGGACRRPRPAATDSADSSSSSGAEEPARTSLSERFGRLAQLSSQRGASELVRLKIVKDANSSDKKVILEEPGTGGREHSQERISFETEYREYFGQKLRRPAVTDDPDADLPRQLPRDWETDVSVRYRYYRDAGYFRDHMLTLQEYIKWEQWWYRYREWLAKEARRAQVERPPAEMARRLRPLDWRERRLPRRF